MKKIILAILVIASITSCASTSSTVKADPEKEHILNLISELRQDPASDYAKEKYEEILRFATESSDVTVSLSEKTCPWLTKVENKKWGFYLLCGYIAGNIEKQLIDNQKKDNMEGGHKFVIMVYDAIKEVDKDFYSQEIENLR